MNPIIKYTPLTAYTKQSLVGKVLLHHKQEHLSKHIAASKVHQYILNLAEHPIGLICINVVNKDFDSYEFYMYYNDNGDGVILFSDKDVNEMHCPR